jgi:glutaminyl-tRNA synthetase
MPPKVKAAALTDEELAPLIDLFRSIGLNQSKATEAAKSAKISEPLKSLIDKYQLSTKQVDEKQAGLLVLYAPSSVKLQNDEQRGYIVDRIVDGKLRSGDQVTGQFFSSLSCI